MRVHYDNIAIQPELRNISPPRYILILLCMVSVISHNQRFGATVSLKFLRVVASKSNHLLQIVSYYVSVCASPTLRPSQKLFTVPH